MALEDVKTPRLHGQFYTCKRYNLYIYLYKKGFAPIETIPSPEDIKYKWWIYKNDINLERAIHEYFSQINGKGKGE